MEGGRSRETTGPGSGLIIVVLDVIGLGVLFLIGGVWLLHRLFKHGANDNMPLWLSLIVSVICLCVTAQAVKNGREGGARAGLAMAQILFPLMILGRIWLPYIVGGFLASGFTNAFDGGTESIEMKAYYFRAEALRKKGEYKAALEAIDEEMLKFPGDFDGLMLRAEVYAKDYNNTNAACAQLLEVESDEARTPNQRVLAALKRADLIMRTDLPGARQIWERVSAEFPDSPAGQLAAQHLAHLTDVPADAVERGTIAMRTFENNVGLRPEDAPLPGAMPQDTSHNDAQALVSHLEAYPNDIDAREKLAHLYADFYGRVPLAVEQLQLLIALPNQPPRRVAEWLTRVSDMLARDASQLEEAKAALQEIVDRYPDTAQSAAAQARLSTLGRTVRAQARTSALKLGEYEQNIGLRQGIAKKAEPE